MLLCNTALKDLRNPGEEYVFDAMSYSICLRRKVTLTALESDDYETNKFSMWECPSNKLHINLYFVGKNHLKDSATIYKRITHKRQEYYYPHTLATKIDRHKLVEDALFQIHRDE